MKQQLMFCVSEEIARFYNETSAMGNADFDIFSIVADYVGFRISGPRFLDHYNNYGYTEDDREDGRILYSAVDKLYCVFDELLSTLKTETVSRCVLLDNRVDLLMEITDESPGP